MEGSACGGTGLVEGNVWDKVECKGTGAEWLMRREMVV